jgi:hypothetical protein
MLAMLQTFAIQRVAVTPRLSALIVAPPVIRPYRSARPLNR